MDESKQFPIDNDKWGEKSSINSLPILLDMGWIKLDLIHLLIYFFELLQVAGVTCFPYSTKLPFDPFTTNTPIRTQRRTFNLQSKNPSHPADIAHSCPLPAVSRFLNPTVLWIYQLEICTLIWNCNLIAAPSLWDWGKQEDWGDVRNEILSALFCEITTIGLSAWMWFLYGG